MDLRKLRALLAELGDRRRFYSDALREAGFTCSHVNEDWIETCCSKEDLDLHRRYLVEYAREALLADSTSDILFEDGANCRSAWLNELKSRRLSKFGPVTGMNTAEKRHLVHLSPCLRELSRVKESPAKNDRVHDNGLTQEFLKRRAHEVELHGAGIARLAATLHREERQPLRLQGFYARTVAEALEALGARLVHTVQMYGPRDAVSFSLGEQAEFILLPSISSSHSGAMPVTNGSVGMGFRLTSGEALSATQFQTDKYVVVNLQALLPQDFADYGRFSNDEELSLNILAWITAVGVLLPDALRALRGPGQAAIVH
jgi:hypothetical protein